MNPPPSLVAGSFLILENIQKKGKYIENGFESVYEKQKEEEYFRKIKMSVLDF